MLDQNIAQELHGLAVSTRDRETAQQLEALVNRIAGSFDGESHRGPTVSLEDQLLAALNESRAQHKTRGFGRLRDLLDKPDPAHVLGLVQSLAATARARGFADDAASELRQLAQRTFDEPRDNLEVWLGRCFGRWKPAGQRSRLRSASYSSIGECLTRRP